MSRGRNVQLCNQQHAFLVTRVGFAGSPEHYVYSCMSYNTIVEYSLRIIIPVLYNVLICGNLSTVHLIQYGEPDHVVRCSHQRGVQQVVVSQITSRIPLDL